MNAIAMYAVNSDYVSVTYLVLVILGVALVLSGGGRSHAAIMIRTDPG